MLRADRKGMPCLVVFSFRDEMEYSPKFLSHKWSIGVRLCISVSLGLSVPLCSQRRDSSLEGRMQGTFPCQNKKRLTGPQNVFVLLLTLKLGYLLIRICNAFVENK